MEVAGWLVIVLLLLDASPVDVEDINIDAILKDEEDVVIIEAAEKFVYRGMDPSIPYPTTYYSAIPTDRNSRLITLQKVCSRLENGTFALVGHVSCEMGRLLALMLAPLGVPILLVPSPSWCIMEPGYITNGTPMLMMTPNFSIIHRALFDILHTIRPSSLRRTIVVFYDHDTDKRYVTNLFLHGYNTGFSPIYLKEGERDFNILENYNTSGQVYIVLCNQRLTIKLLEKASSLGLNTSFYIWITVFTNVWRNTIDDESWYHGNLLSLQPLYQPVLNRICPIDVSHLQDTLPSNITLQQAYLLDAAVQLAESISEVGAKDKSLFSRPHLNCSVEYSQGSPTGKLVTEQIIKDPFYGLSGRTDISEEGWAEPVLLDLWAADPASKRGFSLRAKWTPTEGLQKITEQIFVNPANDFQNKTLKIGIVHAEPFVIYEPKEGKTPPTGFCIDIVNVLAKYLKFRIKYVHWDAEDYGTYDETTGHWTGIIGRVIKKEVDMGVGAFTITKDRGNVAAFTVPYSEDRNGILLKRPQENTKIDRVFLPYHYTVWCAILGLILFVGGLLCIVRWSCPDKEGETPMWIPARFWSDIWFAYGTYFEQSMENYPRSTSGRILVVFWWVFTITMSATYTANLVAYLTVTITVQPINTLEELADSPDVYPIIFPGHVLNDLFRTSDPSTVYGQIWKKLKKAPDPMPNQTGVAIRMVETGKYALLTDTGVISLKAHKECKKLVTGKEKFFPAGLAFVLHKDSPYKNLIDQYLVQMQESGLVERWHSRWWPTSSQQCDQATASSWNHLGLTSLAGAFLLLLTAIIVALILLSLELLAFNYCKKAEWSKSSGQNGSAGNADQSHDIPLQRCD